MLPLSHFFSRQITSCLVLVFCVVPIMLVGCAEEAGLNDDTAAEDTLSLENETAMEESIMDILMTDNRFTTLTTAIDSAELIDTYSNERPLTAFAPTNEAFQQLPDGTLAELLMDSDRLREILEYHLVDAELPSDDFESGDLFSSLHGGEISISLEGNDYFVNEAEMIERDIQAGNGRIHVLNNVLLPPDE